MTLLGVLAAMEVASSRWGESHAAYASFAWCRAGRSAPRGLITDSHHLPQANGPPVRRALGGGKASP